MLLSRSGTSIRPSRVLWSAPSLVGGWRTSKPACVVRDWTMPEEVNRVIADRVADYLFAPSVDATENLRAEGYRDDQIHLVGNVMVDTLLSNLGQAKERSTVKDLGLGASRYAMVTLHRPSNVDDEPTLRRLMNALDTLAQDLPVIFPVHPRTRGRLEAFGIDTQVRLIEPTGYLDSICLQANAALVLTDSGGIQEETTALGVPCLTLRDNTERPITVLEGTNQVVGTDPIRIRSASAGSPCASTRSPPPRALGRARSRANRRDSRGRPTESAAATDRSRVRRRSATMFAALATRAVGQAVLTLALTHLLTLSEFARFAVVFAVARLLAPVASVGTSTAMLSDWALADRPNTRWLITLHGRRVAAGTAAAMALGTAAVATLTGAADWTTISLLGAFLVPVAARTLLMPLTVSLERESLFVLSELARAVLGLVALGALLVSQASGSEWAQDSTLHLWSLALLVCSMISSAFTLLLVYRLAPDDRPVGAPRGSSLDLRRTTQVAVAEVGNGASLTVDQLMLPRLASSMATAQYSVAAQFAAPLLLGVGALAGPHSTAVFETFAKGRSQGWVTFARTVPGDRTAERRDRYSAQRSGSLRTPRPARGIPRVDWCRSVAALDLRLTAGLVARAARHGCPRRGAPTSLARMGCRRSERHRQSCAHTQTRCVGCGSRNLDLGGHASRWCLGLRPTTERGAVRGYRLGVISQGFAARALVLATAFVAYLGVATQAGSSTTAILGFPALIAVVAAIVVTAARRFLPHTALFAALFGAYTLPMTALYLTRYSAGRTNRQSPLLDFPYRPLAGDVDKAIITLLCFLIPMLVVSLGAARSPRRGLRRGAVHLHLPPIAVVLAICFAGFAAFTYLVWSSGGLSTYSSSRIDRLTDDSLRRASTVLAATVSPSLMTLYLGWRTDGYRKLWWSVVGRTLLCTFGLLNLAGGDRRMLATTLIALGWIRLVTLPDAAPTTSTSKRRSWPLIVAIALTATVLSLVGLTRIHLARYVSGDYTGAEFLDRAGAEIYGGNLIERQGEIRATYNTLIASVAWEPEPEPRIFVNDVITLFPLASDLPAGSTHFADLARDRYPSAVAPGQAYGINVAAEGYLAAGLPGTAALGAFLGVLLRSARSLEHSTRPAIFSHLLSALLAAMLLNLIRGGLGLGLEATSYVAIIAVLSTSGSMAFRLRPANHRAGPDTGLPLPHLAAGQLLDGDAERYPEFVGLDRCAS